MLNLPRVVCHARLYIEKYFELANCLITYCKFNLPFSPSDYDLAVNQSVSDVQRPSSSMCGNYDTTSHARNSGDGLMCNRDHGGGTAFYLLVKMQTGHNNTDRVLHTVYVHRSI